MHFFTRSFRQTLERCCWFQAPPAAKKESSPLYCRPGRRTVRNGGESYFPAKLPASVGRSKEAAPHNFEKTDGQQQPQPHRQRPVAQLHIPPLSFFLFLPRSVQTSFSPRVRTADRRAERRSRAFRSFPLPHRLPQPSFGPRKTLPLTSRSVSYVFFLCHREMGRGGGRRRRLRELSHFLSWGREPSSSSK